jgi:hypothetical protein
MQIPVKRRQKTAPGGAVFGVVSTAPQYVSLAALNHFHALAPSPLRARCFLALSPSLPTFLQGTYFGSLTSEPKIDLSRLLAGHAWQYIWDSVPSSPSPSLPYSSSLSNLNIYFLCSLTQAFHHDRIITAILACLSYSALDGSHRPRIDVGDMGEISTSWLASTKSQTQYKDSCNTR